MADVPREGPQRSGRDRAAARDEPECTTRLFTRTAGLQHVAASGPDGDHPRCLRSLAGPLHVRQAAADADALGARGRVPHPSALLTRPGPARGDARRRRRARLAGHRFPQRCAGALHRPSVGRRHASGRRRAREADHCRIRHPRRPETRVSIAGQAPRPRFRLPSAGLPVRWRNRAPGRRHLRRGGDARTGVRRRAPADSRLTRSVDRELQARALDRSCRRAAGSPATITCMRQDACTTRRRARGSSRGT